MNNDLDIWWSAYLAALVRGETIPTDMAYRVADIALEDYKCKAAELEEPNHAST